MEKYTTQIKLILVIVGEYFLVDELSNLLGINPTDYWTKGDVIPLQKGLSRKDNKIRFRHNTVWQFSTGFIKTLDFDDVYFQFEKQFKNKISILKDYIQGKKLDIVLEIIIEIADNKIPGVHFNKNIIKICKELGAELDIDMYLLDND